MARLIINIFLAIFFAALGVFIYYFCFTNGPLQKNITWGVDFSQMQAESLKLDWKNVYLAILEDLGVKNIKLHTQWDFIEGSKDRFYFNDIDWQLAQAAKHGAGIIYVLGMKTGRWPECHIPDWAESLSKEQQQGEILAYIEEVVTRHKNNKAIIAWQAENEPLFKFGECPWYDKDFLQKEVALIKSLDPLRPVIISDSGEQSWWFGAAKVGDIIGITTYRRIWVTLPADYGFYITFPFSPGSYWIKSQLIQKLFGKKVIGVELQAEPWTQKSFLETSLKEQEKTMDIKRFKQNIAYAKNTGLDTFYLWGVEWWYWLKETHSRPQIWDEASKLFKNGSI